MSGLVTIGPDTLHSRRDRQLRGVVVEVYGRVVAVLELAPTLREGDVLTSPLLPDLALPVADIFMLPPELAGLEG